MDRYSSEPFPGVLDAADVQRSNARDSLLLTARMRAPGVGEGVAVRVRNLSSGGLMAEVGDAEEMLSLGRPVEVEVRGVGWVKRRVAWVADGRAGIACDRAADPKRAGKPVGRNPKPLWPPRRARRRLACSDRLAPAWHGANVTLAPHRGIGVQAPVISSFSRSFCRFNSAMVDWSGEGRACSAAMRLSSVACFVSSAVR